MESKDVKFFSYDLLKVLGIGVAWWIVICEDFSKFFIHFEKEPINTIAETVGASLGFSLIPIVLSFFIARYLHNNHGKDFLKSWIAGVIFHFVAHIPAIANIIASINQRMTGFSF